MLLRVNGSFGTMEGIMNNIYREYLKKTVKLSAIAGLALSLSGCIVAVPPAIQLASLALDGVSYITTGKSVTDHAISTVTAQDCAMTRALKGEDICSVPRNDIEVAMKPGGTPKQTTAMIGPASQGFVPARSSMDSEDQDEVLDLSDLPSLPLDMPNALDMDVASGPLL